MPIIKITEIENTDIRFGIWQINESVDELLAANPHLISVADEYHTDARKCERLAIYSLLFAITGCKSLVITYDSDGKPQVNGYNISISHTRGYAALIVSKTQNVAIDIEYFSNRVSRIVPRFMRDDEDSSSVEHQLVNWSAKETVYKLCSHLHLQYAEMRLNPFTIADNGELYVDNLRENTTIKAYYHLNKRFVLTYTYA